MKVFRAAVTMTVVAGCLWGCSGFKPFYVYTENESPKNHYVPTGVMGDYGDLTVQQDCTESPQSGKTCIKINYSAAGSNAARWAGIYWQEPANNWATVEKGGFDLTGAKKLTFWARSEKGGEKIVEFKVGGIQGDFPDTALFTLSSVVLTKEWKKYEIVFDQTANLKRIAGGFCFAVAQNDNPAGLVMYIDEIRYQ